MSEVIKDSEKTTIRPEGDIVASMVGDFKHELKGLLDEGIKDLTIDLANVEMVDSVGLGTFIATHNSLKQSGGQLTISNVSPDITGLLKTMRLDKHFTVVPSE